jgi:hypothetical protein
MFQTTNQISIPLIFHVSPLVYIMENNPNVPVTTNQMMSHHSSNHQTARKLHLSNFFTPKQPISNHGSTMEVPWLLDMNGESH